MVKICPRCGTINPDNAIYCFKCGYLFIDIKNIEVDKKKYKKDKEKS